jgi:hypothetical protein
MISARCDPAGSSEQMTMIAIHPALIDLRSLASSALHAVRAGNPSRDQIATYRTLAISDWVLRDWLTPGLRAR